jgi:hypothetical protein
VRVVVVVRRGWRCGVAGRDRTVWNALHKTNVESHPDGTRGSCEQVGRSATVE